MGLRSRVRRAVGRLLKPGSAQSAPSQPPEAPAPAPAPPPPPAAAPPPPRPAPAPAPAAAPSSEDQEKQEKAAKHLEKTRRAVLKLIADQGGEAPLADVHDHSERRYFVGHQKFSQMMEGLVAEGLLTWDPRSGTASITDAGRDYLSDR